MPRPATPEEAMRGFLMGDDPGLARMRRLMRHLPSPPHCKLCAAPFEGPAGAILRHVGFARYPGNPAICGACIKGLNKLGVHGAEIPASLLFADIRGSTTIGEQTTPTEFRAFLDRFYQLSSRVILENDGIVDKFVGDEVIGLFFKAVSGTGHAAKAIAAARVLLTEASHPDASDRGPIPLGAAVHSGEAYVGSSGAGSAVNDFTALGDVVNTTARLASEAAAGELLVSLDAATPARLDLSGLDRRTLTLRGRTDAVEVVSIRPG